MYDQLFDVFDQIKPFDENLKNILTANIKRHTFPKKSILLCEGELHQYIYFIEKGIMRTYIKKDKEEITTLFFSENDFLISIYRFVNEPSIEYIEALEDTTVLMFDYDQLLKIYQKYPDLNYFGRILIEKNYSKIYKRLLTMLKLTARERYELLVKMQPSLFQRVTLSHIASYLGIKKESLSRIRKSLN